MRTIATLPGKYVVTSGTVLTAGIAVTGGGKTAERLARTMARSAVRSDSVVIERDRGHGP